jgi:formate-nitrite transporter family protein
MGTSRFVATDEEARALKLAMNESRARTSNDRLRRAADSHRFRREDRVPFLCECGDENCYEIVMITIEDYEHIRVHPTWFLLVAGHENDATQERIVDAEQGYAVVEKIGAAGVEAARLHRRHTDDV